MTSTPWKILVALFGALLLAGTQLGCGMRMSAPAGVTTGGAQDIGLARNQIAAGQIPRPETFVIEGLLSEHDIAIDAPPCDARFCMNTAVGWAPALDTGEDALFMVVGLSSNVDLGAFRRDPLNVSVVVDRSGSMGTHKMEAARVAVHRLIDNLREGDSFSLIAFDDEVDVLVAQRPVKRDWRDLHDAVSALSSRGSTDIESALAEGFAQVADTRYPRQQNRVILITDARPNTGRTDAESFIGQALAYADRGIGLTVFGVGVDFGQALALEISRLPGGNYVYIENHEKLARIFDEDFDLLVTPVAWDFEMTVEPVEGYAITEAYGVPSWVAGRERGAVAIDIPTLFLSKNRGAIVLRMAPTEPTAQRWPAELSPILATTELSYRRHRTVEGERFVGHVIGPQFPHGHTDDVEFIAVETAVDPGLRLAVGLVNTGLGLQTAASLAHAGRHYEALGVLDEVDRLTDQQGLDAERAIVGRLRALVAPHAVAPEVVAAPVDVEPARTEVTRGRARGEGGPGWIR